MKYSESLKKNRDFQNVYRRGRSYANRYLIMYVLPNDTERNRFGISVSKKVGNSVIRHHLTRQLRELEEDGFLHREVFGEVPPRVEYTLTPLGESFAPLLHTMLEWSRENLTQEDGHGNP